MPRPLRRIKLCQFLSSLTGSPYHRLDFQQGELIANVHDCEAANSLVRGTFADYGYFDLARRLLVAGEVHVDVGANYGFHTFGLLPSPISSTIRYILIDANPDCVACLRESARLYPSCALEIFHAAAAAASGRVRFAFTPSATGGGHVGSLGRAHPHEIIVPATPLDALFEENEITSVGLMKMDIEGSEPVALRSLSRMLSSHRIKFIYFEVNPASLKLQQTDPPALFQELTRHGYRLFWPHDGVDWILSTYGRDAGKALELQRFTVWGNEPHKVIAFDPSLYREGQFGQCDLLAVSPACRVEPGLG